MLLLLMLGCIVRPMLGLAGELHQVQRVLTAGCTPHTHTHDEAHQHASQSGCHFMDEEISATDDVSDPGDRADGRHAALLHQADLGFVAALPSISHVPGFIPAVALPALAWTNVIPQPASSPFRPPI